MQTETDAVQERSNSIAAPSYRFCCLAGQALPKANNPIPEAHRAFLEAVDLLKKGEEKASSDALIKFHQAAEGGHPLASFAIGELVELNQAQKFYRQGFQQLRALGAEK